MKPYCIKSAALTSILFVLVTAGLSAQQRTVTYYADPSSAYEEKMIDITHLDAYITPDTLLRGVYGRAVYTFLPLRASIDTLVFLAPGIVTEKVTLNDITVRFSFDSQHLKIHHLPLRNDTAVQQLEITYHSCGKPEPYFIGWDDPTCRMRRQIWSHRPFGWIPFINDRLTTDFYITFSNQYKVYSNGIRESVVANTDGTQTWHYRMNRPHPFFSTVLVIGDYTYRNFATASGLPLEYWYYPDCADHFEPTYRYSTEMFAFLEKELGVSYPWEIYRQIPVADYLYGAMETTTATIFGDYMQIDERGWWGRNYVNVNVHELTHQWFGNYIAHDPASDVWLTESMATYYAKLFEKSIFGESYYEREKLNEQSRALAQADKDDLPLAHSQAGSFRWYQKGSLVLDMLRDEMGDSLFSRAITHYLKKFAFSEASSHDFIKAVSESSGMSLNWFFDQWVFRGGEPHFEVAYHDKYDKASRLTEITVKQIQPQTQTTGIFRVTAKVAIGYSNDSVSIQTVSMVSRDSTYTFPNKQGYPVEYLVFDTGNRLLKKLTFKRSLAQLSAAALKAPSVTDRCEALTAMRSLPVEQKRNILMACAGQSEESLIFTETLFQLSSDTSKKSHTLFTGALRHPDAMIRRAAISNFILRIPSDTGYIVRLLSDPDYINLELCLRKLCEFMPSQASYWLSSTSTETGWRGRNIRMAWLEIAINTGNKQYLTELKDYAGTSFEFETRINAIRTLEKLAFLDGEHAGNLAKAAMHWNPKLAQPAREALADYYTLKENRATIEKALTQAGVSLREAGIQ